MSSRSLKIDSKVTDGILFDVFISNQYIEIDSISKHNFALILTFDLAHFYRKL